MSNHKKRNSKFRLGLRAHRALDPHFPGDWTKWEHWEKEEPQGTFQTQRPAVYSGGGGAESNEMAQ